MHFERNMAIGKNGYCLVPGHPKEHVLDTTCWGKLRNWLYNNPNGTQQQYINDCGKKNR